MVVVNDEPDVLRPRCEVTSDIASQKIDKSDPAWKTKLPKPPKLSFDGKTYIWKLETNKGEIKLRLMPDVAPMHVSSTIYLTRLGFYDGLVFHRVIPGFMAQGGDPTGTGMSGSSKPDLKAEFSREPHVRGVCSMARSNSENSANSQFFICFDDARFLDNKYTVWGEVTEGMEHVDALPKGEPPRAPGKIVSMKVAADA